MKKGTFGNLYSPYQKAENDTMDDWYIEYLNDTARIICIDGKYSLQGTTQGRYLTGGVPPVRFSM
ncbi:hypothetical protein ACTQW9_18650 [Lachnospiraceae bacterium LCP19S3_B12]